MHTFGTDFLPIQPMLAPISIVDVFFPGFSAVAASAQQLLVGDVNSYVRLLYMGAVFVVFVRYAFGYAKDLINKYFSSSRLLSKDIPDLEQVQRFIYPIMTKFTTWFFTGYNASRSPKKRTL